MSAEGTCRRCQAVIALPPSRADVSEDA